MVEMKDRSLITNKEGIKGDDRLLICFPYAGSGASMFRKWQSHFKDKMLVLPVHLPGREERFGEKAYDSKEELFEDVYSELKEFKDNRIYLFGHSMGAKIAYEMASELESAGKESTLIVSGCGAPHIPDYEPISHLRGDDFREALRKYNCTPPEILDNKEMFEVFYPLLRSDFIISETCVFEKSSHTFPIIALGATDDGDAPESDVMQWRAYSDDCRVRIFEGDHFFIREKEDEVLDYLIENI